MKKVVLAFALFAFVGASAVEAAPVRSNNDKEKTEKKEKKNKKSKGCTPVEMKSCSPGAGAEATTTKKSCCASKAAAAAPAQAAPAQ